MLYKKNSIKSYFIIAIATVLLYVWQLHLYSMINPDGVTYLEAAAAYLKGGVKAAIAMDDQAKWPFYSVFIAWVHVLTGQSLLASERILDLFLIAVSACFFLYFVRLFSRHKQASFWAIVIWLTWHAYVKWWPVIVRDHGFITALLLSFYSYYRFTVARTFFWAFIWSLCMVLAEIFRIEAIVYLALIPFSVFFWANETWMSRIKLWLKLNVLSLFAAVSVVALFFNKTLTVESLRFAYMWQEFSLLFSTITHEFMARYQEIHQHIFNRENDFSAYALLASYLVVFIGYVITQISWAGMLPLFLIRRVSRELNDSVFRSSFLTYLSLSLVIPLLFFVEHVFLNGRYLLPLGLFVLLLVASILPHLIDSFSGKRRIVFIGIMTLFLAMNFSANVYPFGHLNYDEKVMGEWVKAHYPNDMVFTNSKLILFYASSSPDYKRGIVHEMWLKGEDSMRLDWLQENKAWCQCDILVFNIPVNLLGQESAAFIWLQQHKALGPVVKRYKRVFHQGDIIVAPILKPGCFALTQDKSIQSKK